MAHSPVFWKFSFCYFLSFWSFPSASSCLSEVFLLPIPVFLKFSFYKWPILPFKKTPFPSANSCLVFLLPFLLSEVFILSMAHSPVFLKFSFYQSLSEVFILSVAYSPFSSFHSTNGPVFLKFSSCQGPTLLSFWSFPSTNGPVFWKFC